MRQVALDKAPAWKAVSPRLNTSWHTGALSSDCDPLLSSTSLTQRQTPDSAVLGKSALFVDLMFAIEEILLHWNACYNVKSLQSCLTLCAPVDCSLPGSSVHEDSPGKNTRVGCHALFQGIFPTQGSHPCLLHCRQILHR